MQIVLWAKAKQESTKVMRVFDNLQKVIYVAVFLCLCLGTNLFLSYGQITPNNANSGTTNSGPTGNYPGTGSSITNVPTAPRGIDPGAASAGAIKTGPTGTYPGTGSSVTNVPTVPRGTDPGAASAGAIKTGPTGTYPGTGSSITNVP